MKEKLLNYLRSINSSINTINAVKDISEEHACDILSIIDKVDLDDITLFYMGRCPYSIRIIKSDINKLGIIDPRRYDSMVKLCFQLGYCNII